MSGYLRFVEQRGMFEDLIQEVGIGAVKDGPLRTVVDVQKLEQYAQDNSHHYEGIHCRA
jgi:hypothetical protein